VLIIIPNRNINLGAISMWLSLRTIDTTLLRIVSLAEVINTIAATGKTSKVALEA